MMKFLNPWVALGVVLALLAAGVMGYRVGSDHEIAKHAKDEAVIAAVALAAQQAAATEISKIKIVNQTHRQVVEREIRNVPSGTCVLSPDGVRAINEILTGKSQPADRGELPGAGPAR